MASVFSLIVKGDIPSYKVAEDDKFFAFLDINPLVEGHTLVVPKKEVDKFFDIEDDDLSEMIVFAKRVAERIEASFECNRVAVIVLGLEVAHAHIHLIPMKSEKDVDFSREKLSLTPERFTEIANMLSK